MQFHALTSDELEQMLIRAAKLGAAQFRDDLNKLQTPEIMIKAEVAAYLRRSIATINNYMNAGLPHHKGEGGRPLFYKAEVDEWLRKRGQ